MTLEDLMQLADEIQISDEDIDKLASLLDKMNNEFEKSYIDRLPTLNLLECDYNL